MVISGDPTGLDEAIEAFTADGLRAKKIPVDYASHSAQVEEIRETLAGDAGRHRAAPVGGAVLLDGDRRARRHHDPGHRVLDHQPPRDRPVRPHRPPAHRTTATPASSR
ncbi:hypothetical protein [Streptomyces thioluteus]|uniref:hypothetical protein n=1 Tax=Streptomyces thioluteus TaxID=66431 RepID=UPI0031ED2890